MEKETIAYKNLDEALLAGAEFTYVGSNGEYVETLTHEDSGYWIRRWIYGVCVKSKVFKSIDSILIEKKYSMWKNPSRGKIRKHYSLDEIKESLKKALDAKGKKLDRYHVSFLRDNDDYSNYELGVSKYFIPTKYYLEVTLLKRMGFSKPLFMKYAEEDILYSKYSSELIDTLKKLKLEEGWFRYFEVKIEGED